MVTTLLTSFGCQQDQIEDVDRAFFRWNSREVLCGVSIDSRGANSLENLKAGIRRAAERQEVLVMYGHKTGSDFSVQRVRELLEYADSNGVAAMSVDELSAFPVEKRAGIAMTFDDQYVDEWFTMREAFEEFGGRATFYVTRAYDLSNDEVDKLQLLEQDGHAIGAHGVNHLNGVDYSEDHGATAYVENEVLPNIERLQDYGFSVRSFAYPYGARRGDLDSAILQHVDYVRALVSTYSNVTPLGLDACPINDNY